MLNYKLIFGTKSVHNLGTYLFIHSYILSSEINVLELIFLNRMWLYICMCLQSHLDQSHKKEESLISINLKVLCKISFTSSGRNRPPQST